MATIIPSVAMHTPIEPARLGISPNRGTAASVVAHGTAAVKKCRGHRDESRRRAEQAIARARDEGQIPADAGPRQLSRFYGAVAQSPGVMHKAFGDIGALRDIVAVAMRSWPGVRAVPRRTRTRPRKSMPVKSRH